MSPATFSSHFFPRFRGSHYWLMGLCMAMPHAQAKPACDLLPAFDQPNANVPGKQTQVHKTADGKALVFVSGLHTNTDGAVRSYKVSDFWGEKDALNNLCNAMTDACEGLTTEQQMRNRREVTQAAEKAGWPADQLKATKISPAIIAFNTDGKPCTNANGFLVSATSLKNSAITDICSHDRYIDALKVSAIVLPKDPIDPANPAKRIPSGFSTLNAKQGDLVAVWKPGQSTVHFAVVGDHGPANKLGEASIALNGRLLGKTSEPVNYRELRGKAPFVGKAWGVNRAVTVVFANTRDSALAYTSQDRIDAAAKPLFEAFGGLERLKACAK
jgi:hypothetical protein